MCEGKLRQRHCDQCKTECMYACLLIKSQETLTIYFALGAHTLKHSIHQKELTINSSDHTLFTKAISNHQFKFLTREETNIIVGATITILAKSKSKQEQMNLLFSSTCVTLLQASHAIS